MLLHRGACQPLAGCGSRIQSSIGLSSCVARTALSADCRLGVPGPRQFRFCGEGHKAPVLVWETSPVSSGTLRAITPGHLPYWAPGAGICPPWCGGRGAGGKHRSSGFEHNAALSGAFSSGLRNPSATPHCVGHLGNSSLNHGWLSLPFSVTTDRKSSILVLGNVI